MLSHTLILLRILALLPNAEIRRRCAGPKRCVAHFRGRGMKSVLRTPSERVALRNLIYAVDRLLPDGGNCYRRALIEIALDATSAAEPLHFGLVQHGGPKSGHAWLNTDRSRRGSYDAEFTI